MLLLVFLCCLASIARGLYYIDDVNTTIQYVTPPNTASQTYKVGDLDAAGSFDHTTYVAHNV